VITVGGSDGTVFRGTGRLKFEFTLVGDCDPGPSSGGDPVRNVTRETVLIALGRPVPSVSDDSTLSIRRSGEGEPGRGENRGRFRGGCPFCKCSKVPCGELTGGPGAEGEAETVDGCLAELAAGLDGLKVGCVWEN
jgi:hypothetical protein